jgi:signal transduction histidine kinase
MFNTMAASFEQSEQTLKAKVDAATVSLSETIEALSQKNLELDNTREAAIELERSKAILEERERIMRDMHDGIGGQLVASIAMIESEKDSKMKEGVLSTLTDCLNDLRLIIHSLSMQSSNLSNLLADFKYRISRRLEQLDIELEWSICMEADEMDISPQVGLHLLRILQESFTNTLKHAKATTIKLEVVAFNEGYKIIIEDDGEFNPPSEPEHAGHGLKNMYTRATKLGASLIIEKSAKGGCLLTLIVPKHTAP